MICQVPSQCARRREGSLLHNTEAGPGNIPYHLSVQNCWEYVHLNGSNLKSFSFLQPFYLVSLCGATDFPWLGFCFDLMQSITLDFLVTAHSDVLAWGCSLTKVQFSFYSWFLSFMSAWRSTTTRESTSLKASSLHFFADPMTHNHKDIPSLTHINSVVD